MSTKKVKIEIKSCSKLNGSVLFEYESVDNTIKKTVEEAVKNDADLRDANLRYANLGSADLREANLRYANLGSANLREANLGSADLRYADLRYANLGSADLREANLRYADLRDANLTGVKNLDSDKTDFWWHVHHEILVEQLNEPLRARINYIKKNKPKDEVELRLKLLTPVLGIIPSTKKGWNDLHKIECGCAYSFTKKTIFTKANGLAKDVK
jgi:uncharacterized protein YjbI with pentapeptide repeats